MNAEVTYEPGYWEREGLIGQIRRKGLSGDRPKNQNVMGGYMAARIGDDDHGRYGDDGGDDMIRG